MTESLPKSVSFSDDVHKIHDTDTLNSETNRSSRKLPRTSIDPAEMAMRTDETLPEPDYQLSDSEDQKEVYTIIKKDDRGEDNMGTEIDTGLC